MVTLTSNHRRILSWRNRRHRIIVAVEERPAMTSLVLRELRREKVIVWLDRDVVFAQICDVYLLTPMGLRLCTTENITVRE